jgi:hypothetical protein
MSRHRHSLATILFPAVHLCHQLEKLMSQTDDLRSAIADLGTDLTEAVERIETKLANADADVDLTAEIDQLRSFGTQLDSLGTDPETPDAPFDPGGEAPVEP